MDRAVLFPSVIPEAAIFALNNAYAFAMAICLDRGTKATAAVGINLKCVQRLLTGGVRIHQSERGLHHDATTNWAPRKTGFEFPIDAVVEGARIFGEPVERSTLAFHFIRTRRFNRHSIARRVG